MFLKKLFYITAIAMLIAGATAVYPFYHSCLALSEDVLRVHILANSNSAADQSLKMAVRDRVLEECSAYYQDCSDKDEAMEVTRRHLAQISDAAYDEVCAHGFRYPVRAQISRAYFPTRYYEEFTMPAGWYDSLRLTIGDGGGDNWWCVMYPTLCVGAASKAEMSDQLDEGEYRVVTSDKLDFRFKLVEYFEDIVNWFR